MSAAKKKTKTAPNAKTPATLPFLVEIGTEELPPKSLRKLALAFLEHFEAQLVAKGLLAAGSHNEVFFSPRRLALYAPALYPRQPDRSEEKLGPAVAAAYDAAGMPTKAAEGFAKSCGTSVDKLARKQTDKGERLAFTLEIRGETAATLLPGMVQEALAKLPIGKRMRWGAGTAEFVRPVHWVLMLLGDKTVKADILGLSAGDKTFGHRFHHPAAIPVKKASDYRRLLEKTGKVLVEDRDGSLAGKIGALVTQAAAKAKGKARLEQPLLEEVAALVEWPVPLVGDFDPRFLALPEEVIEVVLQGQQRYFPLRDAQGKLLPHFVTVSNVQSKNPKEVKRGNERVIVPRLTDAMFFWDLDKNTNLNDQVVLLEKMLFQKELGTYLDKQKRVGGLAHAIAERMGVDPELAVKAALLAKCDLLSNLVGEFPELQGSVGYRVALVNGEASEVARAIEEHYLPRFAGDRLPESKTGQALAIADKLDTVSGIFAIGQKPSGDKDPYALRRAGLGLMRILVEKRLNLDLGLLIRHAVASYAKENEIERKAQEILEFLLDRLRSYYQENGIRTDVFEAARTNILLSSPFYPLDFGNRIKAVNTFLSLPEAASLAAANKRISNILRQANNAQNIQIIPELLEPGHEEKLYASIKSASDELGPLIAASDYTAVLLRLAKLRDPVDAYFEKVMVMTDNIQIRNNRLALLDWLRSLFLKVADLSLIQIE
jgi:glycyl-tRNA synthetase beta chain